jgi:hypothetical protein
MLVVLGLLICCCPVQAGIIIKPSINPEDLLGTLSVTSNPSGADIFIDGSNAGQTPLSKSLAIGTYTITVSKTGYVEQSRQIEIKSRSTTTANFQLIPSISTGILSLDSTPSGATIFIDNVAKGTTPVTVQNFRVGTYTITLKKAGYQDITEMVNVVAGQTTTFSPVLKPLAASGTISVNSVPTGASVYFDGTSKGQTPTTITGVSTGSHTLQLTKIGYTEYSAPVTVYAGQTLPLTITLTPSGPIPDPNPQTTGSISVSSDPTGAKVTLDGEFKGTTPVTLSGVKAGDHTVKLTLSGYSDYSAALSVVGGEVTPLKATLIQSLPNSTKGSVSIASIPAGAQVLLRGQDRGKTPVSVTDLEAGDYPIILNLEGYNSWPGTISVTSGQTTSITLKLTPINQDNNTPLTGTGSLIITSSPSGANVYLNGDLKGTTPLTLQNVDAGFQKLLFTMNGYADTEEIVEVKSGGTEKVAVTMKGGNKMPGFTAVLGIISIIGVILLIRGRR